MPHPSAQAFLAIAPEFQLGKLETEQPHPLTINLSAQARDDLPLAVTTLRQVDALALERMRGRLKPGAELAGHLREVWASGGRLYLAGCGATGRLSLALECFAREGMLPESLRERVLGFMAGGDAALIRSIEGFEDLPEHGARQLRELGFGPNDLLVASTEGGETSWVIGATETAAEISKHAPWFLYGNPDELLRQTVERSRRVIERSDIRKWNLAVGPMALAGSTRMQASTVLMLGIGLAMLAAAGGSKVPAAFERFMRFFKETEWSDLAALTEAEAALYQDGGQLAYASADFGLTVLTDTTERSPTFSLAPFPNARETKPPRSLCSLAVPGARDSAEAWSAILHREPRCLEWPECQAFTGRAWIEGYALAGGSMGPKGREAAKAPDRFVIGREDGDLLLCLDAKRWRVPGAQTFAAGKAETVLFDNVLLKLLLNAHSTLVMGRLGRYRENLMVYVRASNHKLIDRAIRYVRVLHASAGHGGISYEAACEALFAVKETLGPEEPVVLRTLERLQCQAPASKVCRGEDLSPRYG